MSIKVLLRRSCAAKDYGDAFARDGRNEDLEKLYQNGLFGGHGDAKRPIPFAQRVGLVPEPRAVGVSRLGGTWKRLKLGLQQ